MDIISKAFSLRSRRMFLTSSLVFLVSFGAHSQKMDSLSRFSPFERDFQLRLLQNRYLQIPSLLEDANISKFTFGKVSYLYADGDHQHPQYYKKQNGIALSTASLSPLKNTNWVLFGSLGYRNTRNEDVGANLNYSIYEYSSPYYFFQKREGLWNHQNYNFEIGVSNAINEKLSLGGWLNYDANFYYRKNDTRSEHIALAIDVGISASYQLFKNHTLSVFLGNGFFKSDVKLFNAFKASETDPDRNIYFNAGLGSFFKDIREGAEAQRNIPKVKLQWLFNSPNYDLSIQSTTKIGNQEWINNNINRVENNNSISQYDFVNQTFHLVYNKYNAFNTISLSVIGDYTNGTGKMWEETLLAYNKNFTTTQYRIKAKGDSFFLNKTLNTIGFGIEFFNQEANDANFGYRFDHSYFISNVTIGLNKTISKKTAVFSGFGVGYRHSLRVDHNPFAARNLFVDWIGNPLADFFNTNTLEFSNYSGATITLTSTTILEFGLSTEYWYALDASNPIGAANLKNKDYLQFAINARLFF